MKLNAKLAKLLALSTLSVSALVAQAEDMPPGPMMHGPGMEGGHGPQGEGHGPGMPMMHGLKLSDEQQDKVFAIMHGAATTMHEQEKALRKAREGLREMAQGSYDEAKAKALADAEGKAVAALSLLHARTHAQVLALLTPEQKKQFEMPPHKGRP